VQAALGDRPGNNQEQDKDMITAIIPAAGQGTRLNLPYPKEIYRVDRNQALIDFTFDFFKGYTRDEVEFVVIINEHKTDIVKYLSRYKSRFNISFTYQNPAEKEYTGAVKSAAHLFGEYNVFLLPDTIMTLAPGADLGQLIKTALANDSFAFLYKPETDPAMLKTKGALTVENGVVTAYEDKPKEDLGRFNAFYCSFAFKRDAFDSAMAFMEKSTLGLEVDPAEIRNTPLYLCKGIPVVDFVDLGTWPELRRMLREVE